MFDIWPQAFSGHILAVYTAISPVVSDGFGLRWVCAVETFVDRAVSVM